MIPQLNSISTNVTKTFKKSKSENQNGKPLVKNQIEKNKKLKELVKFIEI